MHVTEKLDQISAALVAFGAEARNPANSARNPFHGNRYAPLPDVLDHVRPLLAKHGLTVVQLPTSDGDRVGVETIILHQSGQCISSAVTMSPGESRGTSAAQQAGIVLTYLRRYSLLGALNLAGDDDVDGEVPQKSPTQSPAKSEQPIELQQLAQRMKAALEGLHADDATKAAFRDAGALAYKKGDAAALSKVIEDIQSHDQGDLF